MQNLKVQSSAYPDGRRITYDQGMPAPKIEDMATFVKSALMDAVKSKHSLSLKLLKRNSA